MNAARNQPSFDPEEEFRLATFRVGDDLYAIDIMRIKEIVRPLPMTPVPKAPAGMVGVIDLRGSVLPLFDLRLRFDLPPRTDTDMVHVRHVIVTLDSRILGLVVDATATVAAAAAAAAVRPPHPFRRSAIAPPDDVRRRRRRAASLTLTPGVPRGTKAKNELRLCETLFSPARMRRNRALARKKESAKCSFRRRECTETGL